MIGTPGQVEWAERLKRQADAEFDRVVKAFQAVAETHTGPEKMEIGTIIEIVEQQRYEAMANERAGYFIRNWQEPASQVRTLMAADARYTVIQERRANRRLAMKESE